jgi:hypothetical protein
MQAESWNKCMANEIYVKYCSVNEVFYYSTYNIYSIIVMLSIVPFFSLRVVNFRFQKNSLQQKHKMENERRFGSNFRSILAKLLVLGKSLITNPQRYVNGKGSYHSCHWSPFLSSTGFISIPKNNDIHPTRNN